MSAPFFLDGRRRKVTAMTVALFKLDPEQHSDLVVDGTSPLQIVDNDVNAGYFWNSAFVLLNLLTFGLLKFPTGRLIWTAHPENEFGVPGGFWEAEVLNGWERVRVESYRWWKASWIENFRMEQKTFIFLVQRYGYLLERETTRLRRTIPVPKRMAIILYYIAHSETFSEIAALFHIGVTTVGKIVHDGVEALVGPMTADNIVFPVGKQLLRTMRRFEELSGLPMCGGAIDGTFTKILKPEYYGDSYWCYKQYSAVLLFACVDPREIFTFVDVGSPGSVGDAAVFNNSQLKTKVEAGDWLNHPVWQCNDATAVRPYLVGDSAFSLKPSLMKIFPGDNLTAEQKSFNEGQILTRRVVECAFGKLKERFPVVKESNSNDTEFVSKVDMICCSLHNMLQRSEHGYLPNLVNHAPVPLVPMNPSPAQTIRNALAAFMHS